MFKKSLMAVALASVSFSASALEVSGIKTASGLVIKPTVSLTQTHNDNWMETATNTRSTWVTNLAPAVEVLAERGVNYYSLNLSASRESYSDNSNANNTDFTIGAVGHMEFSKRSRLDLNLSKTTDEDNKATSPEDFDSTTYGVKYGYGAESAKMQLEFAYNRTDKRYDLAAHDGKESDVSGFTTTAYYKVGGFTKALVEYRYNNFDYVSLNSLDSKSNGLLAGVTWDMTGKTTGSLKVGSAKKDFSSASIADRTTTLWETGITWNPKEHATFTFDASTSLGEGSSTENYKDTDSYKIGWMHQWNSSLKSDLSFTKLEEKFKGCTGACQTDTTDTTALNVTYAFRPQIDFTMGIGRTDKSSTDTNSAYDANTYYLGVVAGF